MGSSVVNVAGQLDSPLGQLAHRIYYCRLPYSQYPSFGKVLRSFDEDEIDKDGKMETIRKSEMEIDNQDFRYREACVKKGLPYGSTVILPQSLIRSCTVPDLNNMKSSPDTASVEYDFPNQYNYQSKNYAFMSVTNLQPGKDVLWYHRETGFHLGKVYYTGIDISKFSNQERNKVSDLTVFISFQHRMTELKGVDMRRDMGIKKYIYPIEWVHLISLSNFFYLMEHSSIANFKYELREAGVVEVKNSKHAKNFADSIPPNILNKNTFQKASYESTRTPGPSTSRPSAQPLTKSKVLPDDSQFSERQTKENLDYILNNLSAQTPRLHLHGGNGEMPPARVKVDKKPVSKMESITQHISSDSLESHKLTCKKAKLNADTTPFLREKISSPKNKFTSHQKHVNKDNEKKPAKCEHENLQGSSKCRAILKGFLEEKVFPKTHVTSNQGVNYETEENRVGIFMKVPLSYDHALQSGRKFGIQGSNNSCYADSVLFSLFAFTNVFDHCLKHPRVSEGSALSIPNKAIANILKYDIVSPLRNIGYLQSAAVQKLRQAMEIHNANFVGSFMDAEDFILTLFGEILDVPKFHIFDNNAEDYVLPIHVMFEGDKKTNASLQVLLERSLEEIDVKLCGIPSPAFIVKLAVCNGKPLFEKVRPNLTICLDKLLNVESLKATEKKNQMLLRAVICLNYEHYTTFVRMAYDKYSDWIYFDSRPVSQNPQIVHIPDLSKLLENPDKVYMGSSPLYDPHGNFDFLMRNAYICVYEPLSVQETTL